jgi:hypothetical protein
LTHGPSPPACSRKARPSECFEASF